MKKNILFVVLSAGLLTSSCSDFLDVQPEGDATTTTYFTSDQQAIDAVDALYETLPLGFGLIVDANPTKSNSEVTSSYP